MKRILALMLVFVMIFAFAACNKDEDESKPDVSSEAAVSTPEDKSEPASAEESSKVEESEPADDSSEPVEESSDVTPPKPVLKEAEEPAGYIWLSNTADNKEGTALVYRIDAAEFEGKSGLRVFASMKFEDIVAEGEGLAFANIYFYGENDEMLGFEDWACSRDLTEEEMGKWYTFEYDFELSKYEKDGKKLAYATVGIGFWNATGKLYSGPINLSASKEMFWNRSFNNELDLEDEALLHAYNINNDTFGLTWEVVYDLVDSVGHNLATDEGTDITVVSPSKGEGHTDDPNFVTGMYNGILNDGAVGIDDLVPQWYGFNAGADTLVEGSIDDISGKLGTIIVDLGSAKEFNRARLYYWYNSGYGVGKISAARAYYSDDKENWTEFGDLLFEIPEGAASHVGWADSEVKTAVTARYVKFEYLIEGNAWGMVSEVEVIAADSTIIE